MLFSFALIALLLSVTQILQAGNIPYEIRAACAGLILLTLFLAAWMLVERRRALATLNRFRRGLRSPLAEDGQHDVLLSEAELQVIRERFESDQGEPRRWWTLLDQAIEVYVDAKERQGCYLTRSPEEVLTEDELLSREYHASFHQAVPGILTSLGLLATFVSILIALSGLTYDAVNLERPVTGIETLINGLAGKFVSSICGLVLAVLFTFTEKKLCERQLHLAYLELLGHCKQLFPFLTPTRVLIDLQRILVRRDEVGK